ncbi:SDR family NAD(P)-dependent oxidoreductase [Cyanobium sp. NIES-981]|uniref:SDR family NAD(P)-dependent oxidoreductase n=1 Tax=Cyanobium sp. NIES-981 TaxID=1851505 RepID=UPI0018D319A1|nr:SDR family oxidoreductase [Cyanobium sp. NIES-981]
MHSEADRPTLPGMFDLSGRVALITGGSRGLGKAIARGFAEAGASLVLVSRTEDELVWASDDIERATGAKVACIATDLSRRADISTLAARALGMFGRIDVLLNNAGGNQPQPIDAITDEVWDYFLELNLSSCMALTRALVPQMKERRWGRVIYTSSLLGFTSVAGRSVYSATKTALLGLARANAIDLGPFGITVNCLAPGPFSTELSAANFSQEARERFASRTALGRWGETHELVGPALLLASEAGSYITGTALIVDGGALVKML